MLMYPHIDPVSVQIGPFAVHWYGLTYLAAFALFYLFASARAKQPFFAQRGWDRQMVEDVLFFGVMGVVLGGRLGYVLFYKPGYYFSHPQSQYFVVGRVSKEQVADYARRKGVEIAQVERWLASNLDYDPE